MNLGAAGVALAAWWSSIRSGPWFEAFLAAAALPIDCKAAASQTFHLCAGLTPPFTLVAGCGPFPVCWMWLVVGVVLGIFVTVFVVTVFMLRTALQQQRVPMQPQRQAHVEEHRRELLDLLLRGGHDVLEELAHQRGVDPVVLFRQVVGQAEVQARAGRNPRRQ